jgi:hypothetical protein
MLLLVVLLAQVVSPSATDDIHKLWEELNSTCRTLPYDSPEGQAVCHRRDVVGVELSRMGWCVRQSGLRMEWELCPRR